MFSLPEPVSKFSAIVGKTTITVNVFSLLKIVSA
jgi:hypothetical protein